MPRLALCVIRRCLPVQLVRVRLLQCGGAIGLRLLESSSIGPLSVSGVKKLLGVWSVG